MDMRRSHIFLHDTVCVYGVAMGCAGDYCRSTLHSRPNELCLVEYDLAGETDILATAVRTVVDYPDGPTVSYIICCFCSVPLRLTFLTQKMREKMFENYA